MLSTRLTRLCQYEIVLLKRSLLWDLRHKVPVCPTFTSFPITGWPQQRPYCNRISLSTTQCIVKSPLPVSTAVVQGGNSGHGTCPGSQICLQQYRSTQNTFLANSQLLNVKCSVFWIPSVQCFDFRELQLRKKYGDIETYVNITFMICQVAFQVFRCPLKLCTLRHVPALSISTKQSRACAQILWGHHTPSEWAKEMPWLNNAIKSYSSRRTWLVGRFRSCK